MSEQKPPFKILTGNYTWGMTSTPHECWTFEDGKWEVKPLTGEQSAYYALTIAGRVVRPMVRLRDVESYIEWQGMNDVKPGIDEYWGKHDSD